MMENYGFALLTRNDAPRGLPNGTGLFGELFTAMEKETKMDPQRMPDYKNAHLMTVDEKQISFMNRYFVFRKTHNVNADKIYKIAQPEPEPEKEKEKDNEKEKEKEKEKKEPPKVRKIQGKKVTIVGTFNPNKD